jgi:predicted alpha/beta-hydrolase family hydrolase
MQLEIDEKSGTISWEVDESKNAKGILILSHGAGAGMHHPFMAELAKELSDLGLNVVRFNFPYMEQGRKSPGSPKANISTWEKVIVHVHHQFSDLPVFLSGKSYGGRMASHLLAEKHFDYIKGIIYFGFPLHAPGKDSKDRAIHLDQIEVPQLFLQGSNDKLANVALMKEVVNDLKHASMVLFEHADHSFNTPKRMGISKSEMIKKLAQESINFKNINS